MSKQNRELIRRKHVVDDDSLSIVERHPRNKIPVLQIIILVIVFVLFVFASNYQDFDQSITDAVSNEVIHQAVNSTSETHALDFHYVVSNGTYAEIEKHLETLNKESINKVESGMTPIMLAASRGDETVIDLLFTQGADPNKRGSMQRTALQYATEKNHIEAAKRLLSYGADIDAYDNGRLTPLVMAASRGYTELALIFIDKGADVNIQHVEGWTALIDATAHGDIELVKALLEAGADKELKAKNGLKAIDYAKQYGFKNIVRMLSK